MKIHIVAASRYGSTNQASNWIAERLRLENEDAEVFRAAEAPPPDGADLVILGSGVYAHKLLPELLVYFDRYLAALRRKKVALFALAMSPQPIVFRGESHGGFEPLDNLIQKLGPAAVHAAMLGGQLVYNRLSAEDTKAIQAFYAMLKLDLEEVERRKAPRTLMNKSESWEFAETALRNAVEESL